MLLELIMILESFQLAQLTTSRIWIINDSYDATPSDYVSMIITDYGMVSDNDVLDKICVISMVHSVIRILSLFRN